MAEPHYLRLSDDLGSLRVDCSCGWHTFVDLADVWVSDLLDIEAAHIEATKKSVGSTPHPAPEGER